MLTVQEIMEQKRRAIQNKDLETYLETVTNDDPFYRKEQAYWFNDMIKDDIQAYSNEVLDIKKRDDDIIAEVAQSVKMDDKWIHVQYPLLLKEEDGELKDCGYDFNIFEEEDFVVKYMDGDKRIHKIHKYIHKAIENVYEIFGKKPNFKMEFKMYSDLEILRQRTAPTIRWQFFGWAEPNEALKFYTGLEDLENYQGLIQHELVHLVTLDECKCNTSMWISEGMAMRYGSGSYPLNEDIVLKNVSDYKLDVSIDELMEFDLYTASDMQGIGEYYSQTYFYFDYLDKQYGPQKLMDVFKECGKLPPTDDVELRNKISEEAFIEILGVNFHEVSTGYLDWITS